MKFLFLWLMLIPTMVWGARTQYFDADNYNFGGIGVLSNVELYYLDGVTSNIQTQLDAKAADNAVVKLTGDQSIAGAKTFTGKIIASGTSNGHHPCPTMTQAQRDAVVSPTAGDCVYNSTSAALNIYNGSTWKSAGGGISYWATSFAYQTDDVVIFGSEIYVATTGHTSGTFVTDLQSGNWSKISASNTGILANAGFEDSTYSTGWTLGGTATYSAETSAPLAGKKSLVATASAQTVSIIQDSTLYNTVYAGSQGFIGFIASNTSANCTACSRGAGTTSTNCVALATDGLLKTYDLPTVLSSTSNGIEISCTSTTGVTKVDDVLVSLMPIGRMPEVAQAQLAGEAYIAGTTNCTGWTRSSSTMGRVATDSDCPGPTIVKQNIGQWQTTDADLPLWTVNNLPAGDYVAVMQFPISTSTSNPAVAIYDGTTQCEPLWASSESSGNSVSQTVACSFSYASAGNRAFEPYIGSAAASAMSIFNGVTSPRNSVKFQLYYYPPSSKIYSAGRLSAYSGYYQSTGCQPNLGTATEASWNQVADTDCTTLTPILASDMNCTTIGSGNIGVSCTMPSGKYEVCAAFSHNMRGTEVDQGLRIAACSGSSACSTTTATYITQQNPQKESTSRQYIPDQLCGLVNVSGGTNTFNLQERTFVGNTVSENFIQGDSQSRNIQWTVKAIDNVITGTFAETPKRPGITKPKDCYYFFGGGSATLASPTECTTGTCVEVYDSCGTGTPPTWASIAVYQDLTFAAGTFANSTPVKCECEAFDVTSATPRACHTAFYTGDQFWSSNSSGGFVANIQTTTTAGTQIDEATSFVALKCEGNAP